MSKYYELYVCSSYSLINCVCVIEFTSLISMLHPPSSSILEPSSLKDITWLISLTQLYLFILLGDQLHVVRIWDWSHGVFQNKVSRLALRHGQWSIWYFSHHPPSSPLGASLQWNEAGNCTKKSSNRALTVWSMFLHHLSVIKPHHRQLPRVSSVPRANGSSCFPRVTDQSAEATLGCGRGLTIHTSGQTL